MAQVDSPKKIKEPYFSNYNPNIFYTPMYTESDQPTKPIRKIATEPIKLTVTLKDIGLEGLDSSSPDLASKIFQRNLQKKQRKSQRKTRTQQQRSVSPTKKQTTTIHPPSTQRSQISPRTLKIMVFEGDSIKNKKHNTSPRPIGLLSSSQRSQRPQPIIPKTNPRGSPRLNASGSANGSGIFNAVDKNANDQIDSEKLIQKNEEEEKLSIKPLEQLFEKKTKSDEGEKLTTKPLNRLLEQDQKSDKGENNSAKPSEQLFEKDQENDEGEKLTTKPLDALLNVLQSEHEEAPLEPKYLVNVEENRNQCYDNFCINADRGMPGNPLEKEIKEQEEREAAEFGLKLSIKPLEKLFEQEQKSDEGEKLTTKPLDALLNVLQSEHEEASLEPKYLVNVEENRNQCYDNFCINADRGMPGNPLEKEIKEQEEREAAEFGFLPVTF